MNSRLCRYWLGAMLPLLVALPARATPNTVPPPPPPIGGTPHTAQITLNLVSNGDFETGAFSPQWTLNPGGPFDQVCKAGDPIGAATCITHGGQYAMSFGLAGGQDSLSQSIPTVAGGKYILTFFLANDNPLDQNTTTFAVLWDGSKVFSLPSPQPSFPYRAVVLFLTASTNSTPLTFVAQHDPSQWFLDDVSIVENVPPAPVPTLTLWGMALVALLLARVAVREIG